MIQPWENLETDGWTDKWTDEQTDHQTDKIDFIGRCPTNFERPNCSKYNINIKTIIIQIQLYYNNLV